MFDLARGFFDSDIFGDLERRITLPSWQSGSFSSFYGTTNGLDSGFKVTKDGGYQLKIDLPGYRKDEVDVQLSGNALTVTALRTGDDRSSTYTTSIPEDLDQASVVADLDLGVLRVTALKVTPARAKTVKIPVK